MAEPTEVYASLDLALRVGEVLLSSGAGAADVAATMLGVTDACGVRHVAADVTFVDLSLRHEPSSDAPAALLVRRVRRRPIDYADLVEVDRTVSDLVAGNISEDEARTQLARVVSTGHRRYRWAITLGWGVMGVGIALTLGGDALVCLFAFLAACAIDGTQLLLPLHRIPAFYQQAAGGLVVTLIAVTASATGVEANPSRVVTAGIVMLLAGVGIMGATQDALTGFPLTASARFIDALLNTMGIIAGVGAGLTVADLLGVGLVSFEPGAAGFAEAGIAVCGAAIGAAAFAFASYAPLRALIAVSPVAALGQGVLLTVGTAEVGRTWGAAVAAVTIGGHVLPGGRSLPGSAPCRGGSGDRPPATGSRDLPRTGAARQRQRRRAPAGFCVRHRACARGGRDPGPVPRPAGQARGTPTGGTALRPPDGRADAARPGRLPRMTELERFSPERTCIESAAVLPWAVEATVMTSAEDPADTRMMGIVHEALKRDLHRARDVLSTSPPPEGAQRVALGRHVTWMLEFLHRHHTGEDVGLWPLLRRRNPAATELLDSMEADHARIAPAADAAAVAARNYTGTSADSARTRLVEALDDLLEVLVPHLDREVAEAMPIAAASMTNGEWDAIEQEHFIGPKSLRELAIEGHWLLEGTDAEGRDVVVHKVPAIPRFILVHGFARAYRRQAQARWTPSTPHDRAVAG